MKRLFFVVIAAALLWSGYWALGAQGVKSGLNAWFDARRAEGWVAEHDDFRLRGFPNRFDATWTNLTLADPDSALAWNLPEFKLYALSYNPNHVIAQWPQDMQLATPREKLTITSDTLRASLRLAADTALELNRAVLTGQNITMAGDETGTIGGLTLAIDRTQDSQYRLGLEASDVSPPAPMLRAIFGDQALPENLHSAHVDAHVSFDRPWDITALDDSRPQPTTIDLTSLRAKWGVMEIKATGQVTIDAQSRPIGQIALKAVQWEDMLAIAQASGALSETAVTAARTLLQMAAKSAGNPNSIDVELTFKDGKTYIGFIPIGPAPNIYLR